MSTSPVDATIEPVSRDAFERERTRGHLTSFGYTPNSRGFIFLQICSALLFLIAWLVYLSTGFAQGYWALLSGLLSLTGVGLIGLVVYWSYFARTSEIAFDDDYLYVKRWQRIVRLPWSQLDAETAGFADDHPDGDHGVLDMQLGGEQVSVILFNPFLVVEDFPTFLVELLTQIKRNTPVPDDDDDALDEDDALDDDDLPVTAAADEHTEPPGTRP